MRDGRMHLAARQRGDGVPILVSNLVLDRLPAANPKRGRCLTRRVRRAGNRRRRNDALRTLYDRF